MFKIMRKLAVGVAAASGAIGAMHVVPASAAIVVQSGGNTGKVANITTQCIENYMGTYYLGGLPLVNAPRTVSVPPPAVYAHNFTRGVDRQDVRFRAVIGDLTKKTVGYGPWSQWAVAADNAPATWNGLTTWASGQGFNAQDRMATSLQVQWANGSHVVVGAENIESTVYHQYLLVNGSLAHSSTTSNGCSNLISS